MSPILTIHDLLRWGKDKLVSAHIERSWHEARLLLSAVLKVDPTIILTCSNKEISEQEASLFYQFIERRLQHEPISRILGQREFWSLPLKITPATLDPRADSETLIEAVLKDYLDSQGGLKILDLGTGSGCLLLALLKEYPYSFGVGIDRNYDALVTAHYNAVALGFKERSYFVQGDWGESLKGTFDIILTNPPYISRVDLSNLAPNVRLYDPLYALEGGEDGLEEYRKISSQLDHLSDTSTKIYLEIGQGQEEKVEEIMKDTDYHCIRWEYDLAGIKRCGVFQRKI
jgi:release factor glutamine methyltransferase